MKERDIDATRVYIDEMRQNMGTTSAVWFTGQRSRRAQRVGSCYVKESFAHPGKMLPDLASTIIDTYGRPGDVWLDPMCGIGTTMVEAVHRGYDAFGLEWEPRWYRVSKQNLALVKRAMPLYSPLGRGQVFLGDARQLTSIFNGMAFDKIAFSPPYGNTLSKTAHGPDLYPERQQGGKRAARAIRHGYTFAGVEEMAVPDSAEEMVQTGDIRMANIGDLKHGSIGGALRLVEAHLSGDKTPSYKPSYLTEMVKVYSGCYSVLSPGGMLIIVLRDYRRNNRRVDLVGDTTRICQAIGFHYHDRVVALQCPVEVVDLSVQCKPEGSLAFWTIQNCKKSDPVVMFPIFEDVLVFTKPKDK